ncbi:hypothetical protein AnigIFM49718_010288 [Aspergillus niger]|nr:hypothetical protein AnigIFM49718_010288 [Aspergillus niger]
MRADSLLSSNTSDSCGESVQDDIESLHSLFSEPATGSQSDFSEAHGVASTGGVLTQSIGDVFLAGPCNDERSVENTPQEIHSNHSSLDSSSCHQRSKGDSSPGAKPEASQLTCESVDFDNVAYFPSPQPMDTSLEGSVTFCAPTRSPALSTVLKKGRRSSILETQDDVKPSEHTSSYGKMLSGKNSPEPQFGSFHPGGKTDVPCCTSIAADAPKCLGSAAIPPLSEGHDRQPDTCTGTALLASVGSPQLQHTLHELAEEPLDNPRHPDVHYSEMPDCVGALGPDTVPNVCVIDLDELESYPPVSSPREFGVDAQDSLQHLSAEPKNFEVLLAAVPSDRLGPYTQFQTRQELSVNRAGDSVVPVHATGLQSNDPNAARRTPNSASLRPFPEGYLELDYVEIPQYRPLAKTKSSAKTLATTTNRPTPSCSHSEDTSRAWRLDGSSLSIDIQNASFPIGLGKSSFHVFDGQIIQTLTIVHGPVEAFPSQVPAPSTKGNKEKRIPTDSAAPLSSGQKQYLLDLREQGLTWNEIVAKFPGRKKAMLQAIYYTKVKELRNPTSRRQRRRRRPTPSTRSSRNRSRTQENTSRTAVRLEYRTENELRYSRYNLRSKRVR